MKFKKTRIVSTNNNRAYAIQRFMSFIFLSCLTVNCIWDYFDASFQYTYWLLALWSGIADAPVLANPLDVWEYTMAWERMGIRFYSLVALSLCELIAIAFIVSICYWELSARTFMIMMLSLGALFIFICIIEPIGEIRHQRQVSHLLSRVKSAKESLERNWPIEETEIVKGVTVKPDRGHPHILRVQSTGLPPSVETFGMYIKRNGTGGYQFELKAEHGSSIEYHAGEYKHETFPKSTRAMNVAQLEPDWYLVKFYDRW